jgi:hypothetical protein
MLDILEIENYFDFLATFLRVAIVLLNISGAAITHLKPI